MTIREYNLSHGERIGYDEPLPFQLSFEPQQLPLLFSYNPPLPPPTPERRRNTINWIKSAILCGRVDHE